MKKNMILILLILFISFISSFSGFRSGGENGDLWEIGNIVLIQWDDEKINSDSVDIFLWNGISFKFLFIQESENSGFSTWLIPDSILASDKYKLKIVSTSNPSIFMMSENYFSIYENENQLMYKKSENSEIEINKVFTIYPNPVTNKLTISNLSNDKVLFEIFDNLGQRVGRGLLNGDIDVSGLSSGIYFLKLNNQPPVKFIKI